MKITLEDIFSLSTAVIYNPDLYKSVTSVSIDTRTIKKNSIYVAIKGKSFDGHNYIDEAIKKGAKAVVVNNRKLTQLENLNIPIISVRNTITAYGELANVWRNKFTGKVISITGSNGKTTTKEMIAHLLSAKYKVHKTLANNNNNIGVPLTILSTPPDTDFMVLEHGSNHIGEIEYTAKIAQPDYAIITNIGSSHLEFLHTKEKVLEEKIALFNNVKNDGSVFVNNDDKLLRSKKKNYKNVITFGSKGKANIHQALLSFTDDAMAKIKISDGKRNLNFTLPILGNANTQNILAAVSIALKVGLTKKVILNSIKTIKEVHGRLELIENKIFSLIDDTYNANPESVKNALDVLSKFKKRKNKILILGDMFELGENAKWHHEQLASSIVKAKINLILTIGKNTTHLSNKINSSKISKHHFSNRQKMNDFIRNMAVKDSVIVVKGSRGMKMEEFVEILKRKAA
ncbi:MAG: UDP-N-acetylmuramoyl-tripeptide--D-alanyl-D-alanine ligase [Ignavibacteriales bacterium]|nr:UDP-N-acetylmuramoyl-tripeptide--D-alanyl-D-alanine ligase [Ignavibacteriales bacterium]